MPTARTTVVMATRDRRADVLATLGRLLALPERPPVILVDDASTDGTAGAVARRFPDVTVCRLPASRGAAARTAGVERAGTPLVAFVDDDSWWAPGALRRAEATFEAHPRLGLVAARVLVGDDERLDPTCAAMAASPLRPPRPLPGPFVAGFVACGAIVRRAAYLEVGGFDPRYGLGGEERRLALDLAAADWDVAYLDDVVAHHHPAAGGTRPGRQVASLRNDLWTTWLRRPLPAALRHTVELLAGARERPGVAARAAAQAVAGLPWVLRDRRPVPRRLERELQRL